MVISNNRAPYCISDKPFLRIIQDYALEGIKNAYRSGRTGSNERALLGSYVYNGLLSKLRGFVVVIVPKPAGKLVRQRPDNS